VSFVKAAFTPTPYLFVAASWASPLGLWLCVCLRDTLALSLSVEWVREWFSGWFVPPVHLVYVYVCVWIEFTPQYQVRDHLEVLAEVSYGFTVDSHFSTVAILP